MDAAIARDRQCSFRKPISRRRSANTARHTDTEPGKIGMPHQIDKFVGNRLREYRTARGMSQQDLANRIGISFQQLQKYERASNRIACSRLWEIGETLGAPIPYFFPESAQEDDTDRARRNQANATGAIYATSAPQTEDTVNRRIAAARTAPTNTFALEKAMQPPHTTSSDAPSFFDEQDTLSPQNVIRLARKIAAIRNKKVRTQILLLIDACAGLEAGGKQRDVEGK